MKNQFRSALRSTVPVLGVLLLSGAAMAHPPTHKSRVIQSVSYVCDIGNAKAQFVASLTETTQLSDGSVTRSLGYSFAELAQNEVRLGAAMIRSTSEPIIQGVAKQFGDAQVPALSSWRPDGFLVMPGDTVSANGTSYGVLGLGNGQGGLSTLTTLPNPLAVAFESRNWFEVTFQHPTISAASGSINVGISGKVEFIPTSADEGQITLDLAAGDSSNWANEYAFYKLNALTVGRSLGSYRGTCKLVKTVTP
jgi:hypothetical protein